ncbi:MAG: hypothetical protein UGF89_08655 [Acutalibacteraceae bacterium]|nr:hypothetical protein [Acutalibacteraceae bacterium]
MDNYNNVSPVGYTEMKRKVKVLKTIAIVLTVLSCLSYFFLAALSFAIAPEVGGDYLGPLFSFGFAFFGVVALIGCIIAVSIIWILYRVLKKRIEQGKPIMPIITVIAIVWLLPRVLSLVWGLVGVLGSLVEKNLNFII